jgi:hypothetical protein
MTRLWTGPYRVLFPTTTRNVSLLQIAQTGSGAKPTSYSMDIESFFLGGKAAEV